MPILRLSTVRYHAPAIILLALLVTATAFAADSAISPFLRRPDIHGDQIVFTCEGDLWLASILTGQARRVTNHPGTEGYARFSPDGNTLAFSAQYDGSFDAYTMPVTGGAPTRLTWDPSGAVVLDWTPDGKKILFRSARESGDRRSRLWTVPAKGGTPALLPIPRAVMGSMNSDGRRVAYVPISIEGNNWFRYQGGRADDIWLADISDRSFRRLTEDPCTETSPMWLGDTLYFISERDQHHNLYRMNASGREMTQLTFWKDAPARYPATDGKRIVLQHGNGLALFDPATGVADNLRLLLNSDREHARPKRVNAREYLNFADIGPTGKRVVIESRGRLVGVPATEGDWRLVADSQDSRSQYPAWSPDGKQIAFVSDRGGEEQVWVAQADGTGEPKQLTKDHKGPLGVLVWSPDGKFITTGDREMRVLLVDAETGETTLVDQADRGGTYHATIDSYRFSPDGKWLTYAKPETNWRNAVYLYEIATKKKTRITDPVISASSPVFDPDGKYLYILQDREFNPRGTGPTQFFGFDKQTHITMVTLAADTISPFLPKVLEESSAIPEKKPAEPKPAPKAETKRSAAKGKAAPAKTEDKPKEPELPKVKIDLEGISNRFIDVPVPPGNIYGIEVVKDRILYLVSDPTLQLRAFSMKDPVKREITTLSSAVSRFTISHDGKKMLVQSGRDLSIVDVGTGAFAGETGRVNTAGVSFEVDPVSEWKQIYHEAWRITRDFFYDPNMHGVDWDAVRGKYAAQLPNVGERSELNSVIGEMLGELNTGHCYISGGDIAPGVVPQRMGYLGVNLSLDPSGKAYRIDHILQDDGFDFDERSPFSTPGLNVKIGDYILAVAGEPVSADKDIQSMLVGRGGQITTVKVNSKPEAKDAREIRIRLLNSDSQLRYYDWVASRREYVRKNGGENLGYLHIPDMGDTGLREFGKWYYGGNYTNDGTIYDVRFNGGGSISGMLLSHMAAKPYTWFKPRYGESWTRVGWGVPGYSVAMCNEYSSSNAEEFCDGFQRLNLGPVIGKRTWGGLVGSGGGHAFIDGGRINVPNYGMWAPDGKWCVEGVGAIPDIVVDNDPAFELAGRDPQLDAAIAWLKEQISLKPVPRPTPPPFPGK